MRINTVGIFGNKKKKRRAGNKDEHRWYDQAHFGGVNIFLYDDEYGAGFSIHRQNRDGKLRRTLRDRMLPKLIFALAKMTKKWSQDRDRFSASQRYVWEVWYTYLKVLPKTVDDAIEKEERQASNGQASEM